LYSLAIQQSAAASKQRNGSGGEASASEMAARRQKILSVTYGESEEIGAKNASKAA